MPKEPTPTVYEAAQEFLDEGINPIPLMPKDKKPIAKDWPNAEPSEERIRNFTGFYKNRNIGVLSGKLYRKRKNKETGKNEYVATGYLLIDIDLDCQEAQDLAPYMMPPTDRAFGRGKTPITHQWYRVRGTFERLTWDDVIRVEERKGKTDEEKVKIGKPMIAELRGTGFQTMVPPSIHPSGEQLQWAVRGKLADIAITTLRQEVTKLAAAALLVRYYPADRKFYAAQALIGVLIRSGWLADDAAKFSTIITKVATGEDVAKKRESMARSTVERLKSKSGPVKGFPSFIECWGEKVTAAFSKLLGVIINPAERATLRYYIENNRTFAKSKDGPILIAGFAAEFSKSIVRNDGVDTSRIWEITATLEDEETKIIQIPSEKFHDMDWVHLLGQQAIIMPGRGVKDEVRAAIQFLSSKLQDQTVYTHTGWHKDDKNWIFLFQGGALGAQGLVPDITVELPQLLNNFKLPAPAIGKQLDDAVSAWERLLKLAPARIMAPLVCLPWAAILAQADFTVHLVGKTGGFKTEVATLIQKFFGSGFDPRKPISWSSTAGALEVLAFIAKDTVLLIDDYAPTGSASTDFRLDTEVSRFVRAQGNLTGRSRLNRDSTLKATKAPRGLTLSTGEKNITGESASGRALNIDVAPGEITVKALTVSQADAGLFAGLAAAFIQSIAGNLDQVRARVAKRAAELRKKVGEGLHPRTGNTIAILLASLKEFLNFTGSSELYDQVKEGLAGENSVSVAQRQRQKEDPVKRYFELLRSALRSKTVYISTTYGTVPDDSDLYGWSSESQRSGPQLARVGWVDGDDLYLDPNASLKAANEISNGKPIGLSKVMLGKRLKEEGSLLSTGISRQVNTTLKTVTIEETKERLRVDTWHVSTAALITAGEVAAPAKTSIWNRNRNPRTAIPRSAISTKQGQRAKRRGDKPRSKLKEARHDNKPTIIPEQTRYPINEQPQSNSSNRSGDALCRREGFYHHGRGHAPAAPAAA